MHRQYFAGKRSSAKPLAIGRCLVMKTIVSVKGLVPYPWSKIHELPSAKDYCTIRKRLSYWGHGSCVAPQYVAGFVE